MRPKFATLAAAACLALNVFIVPHAPAAQPILPALGEAESDEFSIDDERKLGEQIMRQIRPDPAVIDDPVLLEYLMSIFGPLHDAARLGLAADVDHVGLALGVEMGQAGGGGSPMEAAMARQPGKGTLHGRYMAVSS